MLSATSAFCWTASWRWSYTSTDSSAHASVTSDGSDSWSIMLIVTWWSSLSQPSFLAVLITAILFWLVCHGQPLLHYSVYRTRPLEWWWVCRHVTTSDLHYENCTGCHLSTASSSRWRYWCTWPTTVCALCTSAKCWHQSVALPRTGNFVLPAAATTQYQELELSSVTEPFQSLDQSFGTPFLSPLGLPTTFTRSNISLLKTHFFNLLNWCYLLVTPLLF